MKHQFRSALILSAALVVVLGCQISNVIGAGPTVVPPTESPVVVQPTPVPPTRVVIPPTAPPTPLLAVPQPTQIAIVPTLPPASPTIQPLPSIQPSATPPPGCANLNATITSLTDNGTVSGFIEIKGTATDPSMEYWKVEYRPEASTAYDQLSKSDKAITDDVLARLSTKTIANGIYFIRLVIVKKDGNFATPCEFRVRVQN